MSSWFRSTLLCAVVFVTFTFQPRQSFAGDFQPIPPEEFKINEVPGQPGAPAIILYHERIDDHQAKLISVYVRLKVLTEAGRKYANVKIPYEEEVIHSVSARTVHPDGKAVDFDGKILDTKIEKDRTREIRGKILPIPDVQVGDILEYRYMIARRNIAGPWAHIFRTVNWELQGDLFQRRLHFVYRPELENNFGVSQIKYTTFLPKNVAVNQIGSKWELNMTNVPPLSEEPYMPPSLMTGYRVHFYYNVERGASDADYWKDMSDYWNDGISTFLKDKHALKEELSRIVAPGDTPEQKVRKVYDFVAGFKNLSFQPHSSVAEMKAMGLKHENEEPVYTVADVMKAKAGTRDDLTRLFVGLVRAAEIPAYAMRLTRRHKGYFFPEDTNWWQLDAEVAIVQIGGKEVFLDPGTPRAPYGILDWRDTSARGIRQNASKNGEIAVTPSPSYKDATIKRVAWLQLGEQGQLSGKVVIAYFGQDALQLRLAAMSMDEEGRNKLLQDHLRKLLPADSEVTVTKSPAWDTNTDPLLAEFKVSTTMVSKAGKRWLLPVQAFEFNHPALFTATQREHSVFLHYPYAVQEEVHLTLAQGMLVESVPAKEQVKQDYGFYTTDVRQKGQELITTRVLAVSQNVFEVSQYALLKNFFEKVKAADDQQVVLTNGIAAAQGN